MGELTTGLISGLGSGVATGWISYRLTRKADRRLARDTGQFSAGELALIVQDRQVHMETRRMRWIHIASPGEMHPATLSVKVANAGDKELSDVMAEIRIPDHIGLRKVKKTTEGFLPNAEVKREHIGNFTHSYMHVATLAARRMMGYEELIVLPQSTQVSSTVTVDLADGEQEVAFRAAYALMVSINSSSGVGLGPRVDLEIQVFEGGVITSLRQVIDKIDDEERELFGLDKRSIWSPLRRHRYINRRPSLRIPFIVTESVPASVSQDKNKKGKRRPSPLPAVRMVGDVKCFGISWALVKSVNNEPELTAIK